MHRYSMHRYSMHRYLRICTAMITVVLGTPLRIAVFLGAVFLVPVSLVPVSLVHGQVAAEEPSGRLVRPDRTAPFCSSPNYAAQASQLFSELEFDDVVEVNFLINDQLRKRIQADLGADYLPYGLLGKHVMYFPVTKTKMPIGMMHFRKMAGNKFGLVTVGWRLDLQFNLVDFMVEGRDPATIEIMNIRNELNEKFRGAGSEQLKSWLEDGTAQLSSLGKRDLEVEHLNDGVHDVLGIVVYLARLTRTSAKLRFSEQKVTVSGNEIHEPSMADHILHFVSIPEALIEQVVDLQKVASSELKAACATVKSQKDEVLSEIHCESISASRLIMSGSSEPYYSVDSRMQLVGTLSIRWIVNPQLELIGVHVLGSSADMSEEVKAMERSSLERHIGARLIPEAECASGTRILVNRVLTLCQIFKKADH